MKLNHFKGMKIGDRPFNFARDCIYDVLFYCENTKMSVEQLNYGASSVWCHIIIRIILLVFLFFIIQA